MTEGRSLVRHSAGNSSCQRQKQLFMPGFCTGGCPSQSFHYFFFLKVLVIVCLMYVYANVHLYCHDANDDLLFSFNVKAF